MPSSSFGKIVHLLFVAFTDPTAKADLMKLVNDLAAILTQASAADKTAG
jgi:hypothetical protein